MLFQNTYIPVSREKHKRGSEILMKLILIVCIFLFRTAVSHMNGEPVYSLFKFLNYFELILFAVLTAFINLFFHLLQWYIIGFVWNKTFIKNHVNTAYKQK